MSFSVETIPPFEREVKRLLRKHSSIKRDLLKLIESLEANPTQELLWAIIFTKSDWQLLVRLKVNPAVHE